MSATSPHPQPLADHLALITGGGSGIGLARARALLADGADVVLAARNADRLAAVADDLRDDHPGATVATVACDVTDEASVAAACAVAAAAGALRIVVANAGTGGDVGRHEARSDDLEQMPLHRFGTTDDIASVVRFLAGPESSWITGECISADGGHHLRRGPNLEGVMRMVFGDDIAPPAPIS